MRVYRPDNRFDAGVFTAVFALIGELVSYRSHIRTLFASDFRASYHGTALGVVWNFILPVVPITVYIFLVTVRVFPRLEGISPAVYIAFNVTLWYLFTSMIRQPLDIVRTHNANAMKTAIPLSAAIASSFADLTFETIVRALLVVGMVMVLGDLPTQSAALAIIPVMAGCIFCLGFGLSLSVLNAIYPDIQRIVVIALQYGIFLSGVIFPISSMPQLGWLEVYNPLNVFIHSARDLVFIGRPSHLYPLVVWSGVGVAVMLLAARFFFVMEHRLRGLS